MIGCTDISNIQFSDDTQIRDLIDKYFKALSDINRNLAKSYCYPNSDAYIGLELLQVSWPILSDLTIGIAYTIYSVDIKLDEATVFLKENIAACYRGICDSANTSFYIHLIKDNEIWYIYY